MKRVLKWVGIVVGGLIGLIVVAVVALYAIGSARVGKEYAIPEESVAVPTDAASVERGKHLAESALGCTGCHGENLAGGTPFADDGAFGRVFAANLTPGQGGVGGRYSPADFERAIRHGVSAEGRALVIMPSEAYTNLSDTDLAAVIAYLGTLPPVDTNHPATSLGPVARILNAIGGFPFPVQLIDHARPHPVSPPAEVTAEYGGYLASGAGGNSCHGADLAGAQPPDPEAPFAPNLTSGGKLGGWSESDFIATLRTGKTPEGDQLSDAMPWKDYAAMTDDELKAVWQYLQSVPAKEGAAK